MDPDQVLLGVYADGVVWSFDYVDRDAIFEESQLFQTLGDFKRAGCEFVKVGEGGGAIRVETKMLPDCSTSLVAVERDGGARKIERTAIACGNDFHYVWVLQILVGAEDL